MKVLKVLTVPGGFKDVKSESFESFDGFGGFLGRQK